MPESCKKSVRFGEDYSLFVTNLPLELNEDGIEKIFKEYGNVKAIMARSEGQFAFISYATYAEAENAIRSLDGKAPLNLRVQFRRKRVDKSVEHEPTVSPVQQTDETLDPITHESLIQQEQVLPKGKTCTEYNTTHDSRMDILRNKFSPHQYHQHIGLTYQPVISPHFMHYPYYKMEYADTNALWSRGSMRVDAAGHSHITMGRGYTSYSISEPRPRIINDITKIYENRHPGCYKYGSDECKGYFGECMYCSRHATLCCSICEGFYCSRPCQIADWSKHQGQCTKIPPLVGVNAHHRHQSTMERDSNNSQYDQPIIEKSMTKIQNQSGGKSEEGEVEVKVEPATALRRPKSVNDDKKQDNIAAISENKMTQSGAIPLAQQQQQQHPTVTINDNCIEKGQSALEGGGGGEKNINDDTSQLQSIEEKMSIDSAVDNFLSTSTFIEVQITSVRDSGKLFSVQKIQDSDKIAQLMEKLNENIQQFMIIDKPVIGEIYGVVYDNLWHRGLVISLNPTLVDYIDWGTIEELSVNTNCFRAIGNFATQPPRFSQLIKLQSDKWKNLETDAVISVKKINVEIENDIQAINVDVLDEKNPIESASVAAAAVTITSTTIEPSKAAKTPPSVLNFVTVGMKLVGGIGDIIDDNTARIVLSFDSVNEIFESLLNQFKDDCDEIASTSHVNYEPRINDLVAVQKPDDSFWIRGYVLKYQSPSIIEIASLDEGIIINRVEKIIPLIPKYNDICIFSAIMMNTNGQSLSLPRCLEGEIVVDLEVIAIKSLDSNNLVEAVEVTMKKGSSIMTGLQLHQWAPWKLESSKQVAITSAEAHDIQIHHRPEVADKQFELEEKVKEAPAADNNDEIKDNGSIEKKLPLNTKKIVKRIELKNNTNVIIQSYRNPSIIFLRSLEPEEIERYHRLIQHIAKSALTAPSLKTYPQTADYVLAQFVDDNYYRAMVISAEPDMKKIKVFYIDYGDIQVTTLDKLKFIPESLMDEPCCVKKVRLYDVKLTPPTPEAHEYLANAVASEEEFVYQFHSSIHNEDQIILKTTTAGSCSVNDQINHLLTPKWERDQPSSAIKSTPMGQVDTSIVPTDKWLSLNDMEPGKLGNIGESISAFFLDTVAPGCKYVFGPEDREMIVHLTSVMPEMMKKYGESTSHYIPHNNELCIALFDDDTWYRGCCFNAQASSTSALIFSLDFGNISSVPHTNIREMTTDFLKPEAFGCVCSIHDFTDPITADIAPQVLARLETLLLPNESYKVEIVNFDGDEYEIKLPEIRATLIEEGLLSS